jgi:hypothetical protein
MPFNLVLKYLGALIDTTDENVAIKKCSYETIEATRCDKEGVEAKEARRGPLYEIVCYVLIVGGTVPPGECRGQRRWLKFGMGVGVPVVLVKVFDF